MDAINLGDAIVFSCSILGTMIGVAGWLVGRGLHHLAEAKEAEVEEHYNARAKIFHAP